MSREESNGGQVNCGRRNEKYIHASRYVMAKDKLTTAESNLHILVRDTCLSSLLYQALQPLNDFIKSLHQLLCQSTSGINRFTRNLRLRPVLQAHRQHIAIFISTFLQICVCLARVNCNANNLLWISRQLKTFVEFESEKEICYLRISVSNPRCVVFALNIAERKRRSCKLMR